jgi:hypothetical protein
MFNYLLSKNGPGEVQQTYCLIIRWFHIKPREHIVKMKEKAVLGVEGVVMFFCLHRGRAEVGGQNVDVDMPKKWPT